MKVTCLIDNLVAGGAQRQLCTLAVLLKRQGIDVSVTTYHPHAFFLSTLQEAAIPYQCVHLGSRIRNALAVRRTLRGGSQDVVLAFLPGSCLYAEIASLPSRRWGLVVSERLAVPNSHKAALPWDRLLHCLADYVTTNSHTNRLMIEQAVPRLANRVITIYNTVDSTTFFPARSPSNANGTVSLLVPASYQRKKNMTHLIEAEKNPFLRQAACRTR